MELFLRKGKRTGAEWGDSGDGARCQLPGWPSLPHLPAVAKEGLREGAEQTPARSSGWGTVEGGSGPRRQATPFTRHSALFPRVAPTITNPGKSQRCPFL